MTLKIISAEEVLFEGEAKSVTLPGSMGSFTVLDHHASLISTLTAGDIVYVTDDDTQQTRSIGGGLVDVDNNIVSVCLY